MRELLELIHIVNKNKVKSLEIISNDTKSNSLTLEFYSKISSGELKTDEEAANFFYRSNSSDPRYKELKRRLYNKLLNTSLFIDTQQPRYDDRGKAYYELWKEYAIAKVLNGKGGTNVVIKLLKKILNKSLKYNFTELSLDISRTLRLKFGSGLFDLKQYKKYNKLFLDLNKVYTCEVETEGLFIDLLIDSQEKPFERGEEIYNKGISYLKITEPFFKNHPTYRISIYFFSIGVITYRALGQFEKLEHTCLEALTFFRSSKKYSQNATGIFQRQLFLLYWQQKKYEEGEELLKEARNYTRDGDISFFTNHSYYLLLCLHAGKYAKAWDIYQEATGHKRFSTLSEYSREKWTIYEAYLVYLGGLDMVSGMKPKKMRIQKFLNEVPIYSRDKSGTNIPILIIQILLLLLYQRYNEVIDRMEALEKYAQRYLRQPATLRSYYFIKMLLKIPVADFHRAGAIRKATPFRKKLDATPLNVTRQAYVTEIIPYELLWDFAMDSLQNTFWKPRKQSSGR